MSLCNKQKEHALERFNWLTFSTFSSFNSRPVSVSRICSTASISGILSRSLVSIPIFSVIVELGQDPHAPCSFSTTTRPSISCRATFPPSAINPGRTSSKTFSTFPSVNGRTQLGKTKIPSKLEITSTSQPCQNFLIYSGCIDICLVNEKTEQK